MDAPLSIKRSRFRSKENLTSRKKKDAAGGSAVRDGKGGDDRTVFENNGRKGSKRSPRFSRPTGRESQQVGKLRSKTERKQERENIPLSGANDTGTPGLGGTQRALTREFSEKNPTHASGITWAVKYSVVPS